MTDELVLGQVEGDTDDRAAGAAQRGVRPDRPGHPRRGLEEAFERGARGADLARGAQGAAHLTGDLALPDDHRVQAGGDGEQVADGVLVPARPQGPTHRGDVEAALAGDGLDGGVRSAPSAPAGPSTSRYSSNRLHVARTMQPVAGGQSCTICGATA